VKSLEAWTEAWKDPDQEDPYKPTDRTKVWNVNGECVEDEGRDSDRIK
jgi:hypothetical protein